MLRYFYFRLRFNQWFKNLNGLKAFSQQCMNWLMRNALRLAKKLKKENKDLEEKIRGMSMELSKRLSHPTIDDDELPSFQKEIHNYSLLCVCIIAAEAFFNFFAAKAIFAFPGWMAIAAQVIFAIAVTWISIPLFRNFLFQLIHENPYKREHSEPRNWRKLLIFLLPAVIIYELGMYNLCRLRGEQIEGSHPGFITFLMILIGMLLPVIAGYFAYERRRYYGPYINTLRVNKLKEIILDYENKIQINLQMMENQFKQKCQKIWAIFQEFKTYKENYNMKHGYPEETIAGHFCENELSFVREAIDRYKKEALLTEPVKPAIILSSAMNNGKENLIKSVYINH